MVNSGVSNFHCGVFGGPGFQGFGCNKLSTLGGTTIIRDPTFPLPNWRAKTLIFKEGNWLERLLDYGLFIAWELKVHFD